MFAVLMTVREFRPPQPGEPVLVAVNDLPAGTQITSSDVGTATLATTPSGIAPDPVGLTPIVTIPAGVPITESMLLGPGLSDHAPPGTILAPVHVSDPTILSLLRVGDHVDLYLAQAEFGPQDSGAELISSGVRVIAIPSETGGGGGLLGLDGGEQATFFGAIPQADANLFTGASGLAPFRVVISSTQTS